MPASSAGAGRGCAYGDFKLKRVMRCDAAGMLGIVQPALQTAGPLAQGDRSGIFQYPQWSHRLIHRQHKASTCNEGHKARGSKPFYARDVNYQHGAIFIV